MMLRILWETLIEHIRPIGRGSARRAAALTLALVLGFGLLPVNALAVKINSDQPDGDGETPEAGAKTVAAVDTVQVSGSSIRTSSSGSASVKKNLNWHELKSAAGKVSPGKAVENTYILELSSGTRKGGGTSDNIVFFSVQYTDADGKQHDALIMPGEDAQQSGFAIANQQGNRDARTRKIETLFGYTTQDLVNKPAMGNVQTDQILFTTPVAAQSIDKIQIFGRRTNADSVWSCQGMRVFRVDTLYGLDMYGWFSDWGYIDFAGELMAQVVMESGAGNFRWNTSGGVFNILPAGARNGTAGCVLANTAGEESVGTRHESQAECLVVFRMDFADIGDAGLETLSGSYEAGKESKLNALAFCEVASLVVRYVDVYDCVREVTLPVAVNALGQLAEIEGEEVAIAGYAQQGDTLAFAAMLPDYAAIQSTYLVTGAEKAVPLARLTDIYQAAEEGDRTAEGNAEVSGDVAKVGPKLGQSYRIITALSPDDSRHLAVSGSAVKIGTAAESTAANTWKLHDAGNGYYYITGADDEDKVIGATIVSGAAVSIVNRKAYDSQRWRLIDAGGDYYYLTNKGNPALYLSVQDGILRSDTSIIAEKPGTNRGDDRFKFKFEQVGGGSPLYSSGSAVPGLSSGDSVAVFDQSGYNTANAPKTSNVPAPRDFSASMVLTEAQQAVRKGRLGASEKDEISFLNFSVYTDDSAGICVNGATVQYRFAGADPAHYITATTVDGISVPAGERTRLAIQPVSEGKRVVLYPADNLEKYLVTITTDNVANAGTTDNLKIAFTYLDTGGSENVTPSYDAREFIKRYYGEWPGNVDDFAYKYGLRDGGTVKLIVPLSGVKQFKAVGFRLEGNDEWQFSGLEIAKIRPNGVSPRVAEWQEISAENGGTTLLSHLLYSRPVDTDPVIFSIGEVYEEEPEAEEAGKTGETGKTGGSGENGENGSGKKTRPKPGEEGYKPGHLIQSDGELHDFDGEGTAVSSREEVDWNEVRRSMTFATAQKGLGFIKQRAEYTISVYVAKDKVNALDDDCGSKNLFYFRLLFKDGCSACTLANQQIAGDGFHTGSMAQFKIYTNQDYGDVTAVQVIPDDQDGKGDIYDKLKIERISVMLEGNKALSPTWEARSDSEDGLGWVGIDYREEGAMASTRGVEGRTIGQLATTYEITKKTYSAKLLVSITTGAYEPKLVKGVTVPAVQFSGGVSVIDGHYYDNNDKLLPLPSFDVVAAMDSYAGRTSGHTRTYTLDGQTHTAAADYAVSDTAYHFRAGREDRFFMTVENITQLVDMHLLVKSDVTTDWAITDVSVSLVNGTGSRYINALGEYDYAYPEGLEPVKVTGWTSQSTVKTPVDVYDKTKNTGDKQIDIYFEPNKIRLNSEMDQWTSMVTHEPQTVNDTLNVYIYPGAAVDGAAEPGSYDLNCRVRYTERESGGLMQVAANPLTAAIDENGRTVYYAYGLDASNMRGFYGVDVQTSSLEKINVPIEYGILQRVRDGVLIETYRLGGTSNACADDPVSLGVNPETTYYGTLRLLLQFSDEIERQTIESGINDLAVALHFRTTAITGEGMRSKYVYLSDMGVTEIQPGHIYELDYVLGDVAEVSDVQIASLGNLDARLRGVYLANQSRSGAVVRTWGIGRSIEPTAQPQRYVLDEEVGLLTLSIKTALNIGAASSGTAGPVRMTVGYNDIYGHLTTAEFENIRPFVEESGSAFAAARTDTVRFLLPECSEIRWVNLEPWHDTGDTQAEWKLDQVEATLGLDGHPITRTINRVIAEGSPLNVVLADILVTGSATHLVSPKNTMTYEELQEGEKNETETKETETNENGTNVVIQPEKKKEEVTEIYTGESKSMVMASGDGVQIDLRLSGTSQSYVATAYAYDPATGATGTVSLDPTHRYTEAQLAEIIANAEKVIAAGTSEEKKEEAPVESGEAVTVTADSGEKVADSENVKQYIAEEVKAAKNVVLYAKAMQDTKGKLEGTANAITFYAPRNYTGADQYYRLVVASEEAPGVFFTVDITVKSELELLTEAVTKLETAQTNTLTVRQTEATTAAAAAAKAAEERAAAAQKTADEAKMQAEMLMGFGG